MLKILQARLQQYVNCELPDVQAGFRKGRGTRDQIVNICWIIEKARDLYADQEAIVRTAHGTTDWFQIGKEPCQGCILSPCFFNLYAEYSCLENPMDGGAWWAAVQGVTRSRT